MKKITLRKMKETLIDFARTYIAFYDALFIVSILVAFVTSGIISNIFATIALFGAINAVVKNARPTLTVVVPRATDEACILDSE